MDFDSKIKQFISYAHQEKLEMIMVGGGAVNFHGYKRHSADIDFWINPTKENFTRLIKVLNNMGFNAKENELPEKVKKGEQNISIKISPVMEIELITRFNPGKTFKETLNESIEAKIEGLEHGFYRVINFDGLIESKLKSGRKKDLLDVYTLQEIKSQNKDS